MAIVISQRLALATSLYPLNHARIGWHNLVPSSTITATAEFAEYPAENLKTGRTFDYWSASGGQEVVFDLGASNGGYDYIAIGGHDISSNGGIINIATSTDNATWVDLEVGIDCSQITNRPLFFIFTDESGSYINDRYVRISISINTIFKVSTVFIGKSLVLARPFYAGHTPGTMSRNTTILPSVQNSGEFIGREIIRTSLGTQYEWKHLPYDWYRENMAEFTEYARAEPFFVAWNLRDHPGHVMYGWCDEDIGPEVMGVRDYVSVGFRMTGFERDIPDGRDWLVCGSSVPDGTCKPYDQPAPLAAFDFTDINDLDFSTFTVSGVQGIGSLLYPADVSITGDASGVFRIYSRDGNGNFITGPWVTSGIMQPGDRLQLGATSAAVASSAVSVTVTVGDLSDVWTIRTAGAELTQFTFIDSGGANVPSVPSDEEIISNIDAEIGVPYSISIDGPAEYQIESPYLSGNFSAWTSADGVVLTGDRVFVRVSVSAYLTNYISTITIGDKTDTWFISSTWPVGGPFAYQCSDLTCPVSTADGTEGATRYNPDDHRVYAIVHKGGANNGEPYWAEQYGGTVISTICPTCATNDSGQLPALWATTFLFTSDPGL